jgi:DNA-binding LytR/AlgR family response regulator
MLHGCKTRRVHTLILRLMSYRRDSFDIGPVVRQPARSDPRTELPGRIASLPQPLRIARELAPPSVASDTQGSGSPSEVILVKSGFKQVATRVSEIVYVEAARNYVRIHQENGAVFKTRVPIERLAQRLGGRFLRIHRGRLVNIERIRSVRSLVGGRLQLALSEGSTIIVARDRRRVVLAQISSAGERRA